MAECPICMNAPAGAFIHGCAHEFCFACIENWCVQQRAYCPMCEQPVWGLYGCTHSTKYLTPHFGSFGLQFKKVGGLMWIECVVKNSIAAELGIASGVYVQTDVSTFEGCLAHIREAMKNKRVLKLTIVGQSGTVVSDGAMSFDRWFRRLFRTKVVPSG